jgi:hypothetical protein
MICFYHPNRQAIAICKYCQRGLCAKCTVFVSDTAACKDRHEDQVQDLNLFAESGIQQAKRVGSGYTRNAVFYFLVGALFTGFGLFQYRFLGLQAVFFFLIGLFLLYAAVANFMESRKYK